MTNYKRIAIYLTLTCQTLVAVGQSVEQECNILKTLDTLSAKVKQFESSFVKAEQLESLSVKVKQLETQIKDMTHNSDSTYIRWGRTSCPGNGSELVYSGYAGGSHYTHTGAAVDYLCLPKDPIFDHFEDSLQNSAYVYGAEYEFFHKSDRMAFFPGIDSTTDIHDKKVPCSVCLTQRASVMMVPARNICHDGWTLEYKGYLSTGYFSHAAASQYVCLDDQPEYLTEGQEDDNDGLLFYFVEGRCGSLRCPPYVNGRELTCAICSK